MHTCLVLCLAECVKKCKVASESIKNTGQILNSTPSNSAQKTIFMPMLKKAFASCKTIEQNHMPTLWEMQSVDPTEYSDADVRRALKDVADPYRELEAYDAQLKLVLRQVKAKAEEMEQVCAITSLLGPVAHLPVYATTPLGYELGMHHEDQCIIDASEETSSISKGNDQCQNIFDMAKVLGNYNMLCFHVYQEKTS